MTNYEKIVESINSTSSDDEETLMEESANAHKDSLEKEEFELSLQRQFYKRDFSNLTKGYKEAFRIDILRNRHIEFAVQNDRTAHYEKFALHSDKEDRSDRFALHNGKEDRSDKTALHNGKEERSDKTAHSNRFAHYDKTVHSDRTVNNDKTVQIERKRQLKMRFQGLMLRKKVGSIEELDSF